MRYSTFSIQPVPSRHGVHLPHDSCAKNFASRHATSSGSVVSSNTITAPEPSIDAEVLLHEVHVERRVEVLVACRSATGRRAAGDEELELAPVPDAAGELDGASRIAIQLAHRMMAAVVFVYLLWLALRLWRTPGMRGAGALLGALVIAQVGLGIANVKLALPLHVAVLHNAGAALLLFVLVGLLARVRAPDA